MKPRLKSQKKKKPKNSRNNKRKYLLKVEDFKKVYAEFAKELPKNALRVSELEDGTKMYLYGYQFVVNRFNNVVGFEHWDYEITAEPEKERNDNFWRVSLGLTLSLGNWIDGKFVPLVSKFSYGSGVSETLGNALKGALTNGFKKAAGMYGVGKKAYEGLIEDYDIKEKAKEKTVKIKIALSSKQLEATKNFEKILINVKDKKSLEKAKKELKKISSTLDSKQKKYLKGLVDRLEKKFNR